MEMARRLRHVMASRGWPKAGAATSLYLHKRYEPVLLYDEIDLLPQEPDVPIHYPPPSIPKKGLGEIFEMSSAIHGTHGAETPGRRMNA